MAQAVEKYSTHEDAEVMWRDARRDPPKVNGIYTVKHPIYGEVRYGFRNGWGWEDEPTVAKPTEWLDEQNEKGEEA